MAALKQTFRPEFLNRLDEIVVFEQLGDKSIAEIAKIMLEEVRTRVKSLGIDLTFDVAVVQKLAKEGFDAEYGARPLRRAIQRMIEDSLSVSLLEGNIKSGDCAECILENGEITIQKK